MRTIKKLNLGTASNAVLVWTSAVVAGIVACAPETSDVHGTQQFALEEIGTEALAELEPAQPIVDITKQPKLLFELSPAQVTYCAEGACEVTPVRSNVSADAEEAASEQFDRNRASLNVEAQIADIS